jgi:hypothetical protein
MRVWSRTSSRVRARGSILPTMPGQLTCGNCGHSWWSNASSARTRCGACRSVVYVPAHLRNGANSGSTERLSVAPSHREAWSDDNDANPYSGATVLVVIGLVVIGLVVIIVIAGPSGSVATRLPLRRQHPATSSRWEP